MGTVRLSHTWGQSSRGPKVRGDPWDRVQFPGAGHLPWDFGSRDREHPGGSHLAGSRAFVRGTHTTHCGLVREKTGCKYPSHPHFIRVLNPVFFTRTYRGSSSLPRHRKTERTGCKGLGTIPWVQFPRGSLRNIGTQESYCYFETENFQAKCKFGVPEIIVWFLYCEERELRHAWHCLLSLTYHMRVF